MPKTTPRAYSIVELLLVSVGLTLAVSYRFSEPIWEVSRGLLLVGLLTSAAYAAGYVITARRPAPGPPGIPRGFLTAAVVSQPMLLVLWLLDASLSRIALLSELILLFGWLAFAASRAPIRWRVWVAVSFAGVSGYPTLAATAREAPGEGGLLAAEARYVFTSYHDLRVDAYRVLEFDPQYGGALTALPSGEVLLVSGSGDARLLDVAAGLTTSPVELRVPIDVAGYRAHAPAPVDNYRVTDVLYDSGSLLATYTHWDPEGDCYTLRLVEADMHDRAVGPWSTRFESQPCLALSFLNNESGGRLAVLDSATLLLTVGTFGIENEGIEAWRERSDYGKILRLDRRTWRSEVLSRGHRNPQGLLVSGDLVWSTEHGPQGGDELNLIEPGRDYGWPFESYGTDYGQKTLASAEAPADHLDFVGPVFAWLPSIAISNLLRSSGAAFPAWRGDLIVGALEGLGNGRALFRVSLPEGRPVTVERIATGRPVRDLVELSDGRLLLWDGRSRVQLVETADHVFSQCSGCHSVYESQHGIGPDLWGVVGSPVATEPYYTYSVAMRAYGGQWSADRLDRFLENPSGEVPGTTMDHEGVADPTERAEIIKFLSEMSAGRPE